jgi:hypothetical protein
MENNRKENPFVTSDAVLGEDFFGREEEIHQVMKFLLKRKEFSLLIHGQRKIGKTSLLLKIKELVRASQMGRATFFDLQNKARLDISDVLLELASQIDADIETHMDFNKNDFLPHNVVGYFKDIFLPRVFEKLPPNCLLILLFDEFDSICEPGGAKDSPKITNIAHHKFIPFLTDIKKKEFPLKYIFAVGRNYKDLDDDHYGQITKKGSQVELSYFKKEELKAFIKSADDLLLFEPGAIDRIYELTSGQPFLLQCLASSAFDSAIKQNKKNITPGFIDDQVEPAIKKYGGGVHWLWGSFPPREKIILYLMAQVKDNNQIINYKNINKMAERLELLPAVNAIDEILVKLNTFKIIRVVRAKQVHYDFYVEYFRKWIVVENTLDKIRMLLNKLDSET